jgi:NADPH:quinone reductase-like Zn-dependent oxidoreductase
MTTTMQAVRIHAYGGPEVLRYESVPIPTPQSDDVLIRVHAAAVNPFDWQVRAGYFQSWFQHTLPLTLGWDVSGVVEATGADVHNVQVGESVYARPDSNRDGSYAEYVVVRASEVVPKPQSLDHLHAAAVPQAALVAWKSLFDAANLAAAQTVLIHGAAGGVGTFAVQLAKWRGARVIATASSANLAFLRDLGADEVIDYTATRFEDVVRDVDVVLDTVGPADNTQQRSWAVLKPGGMLVGMVVPPDAAEAAAHQVRSQFIALQPDAQQLAEITRLIDAGQLRPIVSTVLPLQEACQAHALIESRHTRGKIVLQVRE